MQLRLAEATRRTSWALFSTTRFPLIKRGFCSGTRSRTADTEIHTGEQEAGPAVHRGQPQGITTKDEAKEAKIAETERNANKAHEKLKSLKSPCEPSQKLESAGVNQRLEPSIQQKREHGTVGLEEVSCAGLDGTPWPEEKGREENKEYYKHHKASPLSEIEFVDSRKPISRASDKTVDSGRGGDVIGWLPEQLESAEETLLRAAEMWRQNAMRGDPDAPHSRVLRALRGEDF
ncbi:uncharacterized protein LOC109812253 [Cajanus cajan]|uniref:Uncharacterized protein n=1 Tax=Cajanus cajan TaxID=3821 RepID=A0A151S8A2_CAJCA|nr:uncharacterized protein LOC109812253 [Cajanus cajan]KYP50971.1 hypothetical protein KK1_027181 [Cajanus cajan]